MTNLLDAGSTPASSTKMPQVFNARKGTVASSASTGVAVACIARRGYAHGTRHFCGAVFGFDSEAWDGISRRIREATLRNPTRLTAKISGRTRKPFRMTFGNEGQRAMAAAA
jgi:hypothetical protein